MANMATSEAMAVEAVRILEFPKTKVATSGDRGIDEFNEWWSAVDKGRRDRFFQRDFMWWDPDAKRLVWYYALPDGVTEAGGFDVIDFEGGLYAAAASRDKDDEDGERVYGFLQDWVRNSGWFAVDERPGRQLLFSIITSEAAAAAMGYHQLELYLPIRPKPKE